MLTVTISDEAHNDLIAKLELPTKVRLLTGATMFTLAPEPAISLHELRLSDGPNGVRGLKFFGGRQVALFPNATLLSASWSEQTAYEVGRMLAEEALAQQIHVVLGPTINLHRTPLGGRLFEAYSEDPLLSGKLAAAYVRGLQGLGVGACLKHLVANESETERNTVNCVVDEATLREVYLLPFEIAVAEAGAWSVMAAYNDVNGLAATEQNHVINEVLKGEWRYDGLVMSDWFATKTAAPAANGGLDLVMPGPAGPWGDALVAAVRRGEVEETVIDDHVRRLLRLADRVGVLGDERSYPADLPAPDSRLRRDQLTRIAASGITVLTNGSIDGTTVLPLPPASRVTLIGRHATETIDMGGGSAQVNPPYQVSVAEGLQARLGAGAVTITDGVEVRARPVEARPGFVTDPVTGESGIHAVLLGRDGAVLDERSGAPPAAVVGFDDDLPEPVHAVVFTARLSGLDAPGPVEIGVIGAAHWHLALGPTEADVVLRTSGTGQGEEILAPPWHTQVIDAGSGAVVTATAVLRSGADDTESPLAGVGRFGLIARPAPRDDAEAITEATRAAAEGDVAVVVVGLTDEQETEAVDKTSLRLPGGQDDLVRAVAAVAPRTVVIVNAATPVLMPWIDDVNAVLWVGLPGQEGGHAVAAALLGDIEPAGRLVTTFPAADGAAPAWSVTPADGDLVYAEGPFVGYRGHDAGRAPAPAFWFGHGLGYSTWEYTNARVITPGVGATIEVTVTNTGTRTSREVVQAYLRPAEVAGQPSQPVRLVGWRSVDVDPGRSARVEVATDPRLWRVWNTTTSSWSNLPDGGQLILARGLGDIRATLDLST
jgi:beta-glucosidase